MAPTDTRNILYVWIVIITCVFVHTENQPCLAVNADSQTGLTVHVYNQQVLVVHIDS